MTDLRSEFSHDTARLLGEELDAVERLCYETIHRRSKLGPIDIETIARDMLKTQRPTPQAVADVLETIERVFLKLGETGLMRTTEGYQTRRAYIDRKNTGRQRRF